MQHHPSHSELPTIDPITGNKIRYEYIDLPPDNPSPKRVVEKKVGTQHVVEDVIVEIPEVTYKDVIRTVPRSKEHLVEKPVKQVHVRQIQNVKRVPKVVERKIPKRVEIKGEPQELRVVNEVITHNPVSKHFAREQAVVVKQTVKPSVFTNDQVIEVLVARITPKINYVDVHVVVPVKRDGSYKILKDEHYQMPAKVSNEQYNSLLVSMNAHLTEDQLQDLPFKRGANGNVAVTSEEMNAVLLNYKETEQLGIKLVDKHEIFPRGHHAVGAITSSPDDHTRLHSGMSNLPRVSSHVTRGPSQYASHSGTRMGAYTVVPSTPLLD